MFTVSSSNRNKHLLPSEQIQLPTNNNTNNANTTTNYNNTDSIFVDGTEIEMIIITTSQVAVYHGEKRLQPQTEDEARMYLSSYSSQEVSIITAVVVTHYPSERQASDTDTAIIHFREINNNVIEQVISRKDCFSYVGGLCIEDPDLNPLIQHIEGTIDSICGFPVDVIVRLTFNVSDPSRVYTGHLHLDHFTKDLDTCTSSTKSNSLLLNLDKLHNRLIPATITTSSSVTSSGASSPMNNNNLRLSRTSIPLSGHSSPIHTQHHKKFISSPISKSSKFYKLICPGKKVAIREFPNVKADIVSYVSSGDVIHVLEKSIKGFYQLMDHSVCYVMSVIKKKMLRININITIIFFLASVK